MPNSSQITLPNVFYCGAPKAGSSSVYLWIAQHPQIYTGRMKEPMFFGWNFSKGLQWYAHNYADHANEPIIMDATVWYFGHHEVASQIQQTISEPKFILILRDPVDRAWSGYWHEISDGAIPLSLSFQPAIEQDARFIKTFSFYGKSMTAFLAHHPRNSFLILDYSELSHPEGLLTKISEFLNIETRAVNTSLKAMERQNLRPILYDFFYSERRALFRATSAIIAGALRLNWRFQRLVFSDSAPRIDLSEHERNSAADVFRSDIQKLSSLVPEFNPDWYSRYL